MTAPRADHQVSRLGQLIDDQLREALAARAERLGLDPVSIFSPTPGALIARATDGTLLRVDFRTYQARELER